MSCLCRTDAGYVRKFIEKANIKTDYLFFVYTYGMSESVARPTAISVMEQAGHRLDYVNAVLMVDNYLPGFEVQKQLDTVAKKDIEGQIEQVCRDIAGRKHNAGKVTLLDKIGMAAVHGTMGKAIHRSDAAQKYIVNDNCIKCGICAKVCPADNITVTDKVRFSDHCEVCYACVHNCPKNAIHLKSERSSLRFRNENVTIKDIIAANE